jgi:hypothetical protein
MSGRVALSVVEAILKTPPSEIEKTRCIKSTLLLGNGGERPKAKGENALGRRRGGAPGLQRSASEEKIGEEAVPSLGLILERSGELPPNQRTVGAEGIRLRPLALADPVDDDALDRARERARIMIEAKDPLVDALAAMQTSWSKWWMMSSAMQQRNARAANRRTKISP